MPGSEAEATGLLDTYLEAQRVPAAAAARSAGGVLTGAHTGAHRDEMACLEDVHGRKHDDPHHVDEVPVDPWHLDA
jgi:hypothetical protein